MLRAKLLRTENFLRLLCLPLAVALLLPLGYLVLRSAEVEPGRAFEYLTRQSTLRIIGRSFLLVSAVSLTSCVVGIPAAWLVVRTNLYGRHLWSILLTLPLVIPSYVGAFALIGAIGPRGVLQERLEHLFGLQELPSIYGFWGAWLAVVIFAYPYVFLNVRAGLRGIDPALEEASLTLGKSRWQTFREITLPQLRPFISAGVLLVALYTLSDFGAVAIMQYNVFTRVIFTQLGFNFELAALLSLVLVIFTLLIMLGTTLMEGQGRYYTQKTKRRPKRLILSPVQQLLGQLFCAAIVLIALVAPVGVIAHWFMRGLQQGEEFREILAPLQRSMRIAALTALACGVVSLPFAFLQVRYPGRLNQAIARSAYLGYALPGVVVALALVFLGANYLQDWFNLDNYRVLPILIFALMVRFVPQALGPARAALMQVSPQLEEAGLTLSHPRWRVFGEITLPLMRAGLLAGMALVFLTALKELPATLLLAPPEYDTLATRIWSASSEAFYARAAAPALVLLLISALSLVFILEPDE